MIRATHGVHSGSYYFEAMILNWKENEQEDNANQNHNEAVEEAHFRVGWASRQAELEGPVGYDKFSFAYRDVGGKKILMKTLSQNIYFDIS